MLPISWVHFLESSNAKLINHASGFNYALNFNVFARSTDIFFYKFALKIIFSELDWNHVRCERLNWAQWNIFRDDERRWMLGWMLRSGAQTLSSEEILPFVLRESRFCAISLASIVCCYVYRLFLAIFRQLCKLCSSCFPRKFVKLTSTVCRVDSKPSVDLAVDLCLRQCQLMHYARAPLKKTRKHFHVCRGRLEGMRATRETLQPLIPIWWMLNEVMITSWHFRFS